MVPATAEDLAAGDAADAAASSANSSAGSWLSALSNSTRSSLRPVSMRDLVPPGSQRSGGGGGAGGEWRLASGWGDVLLGSAPAAPPPAPSSDGGGEKLGRTSAPPAYRLADRQPAPPGSHSMGTAPPATSAAARQFGAPRGHHSLGAQMPQSGAAGGGGVQLTVAQALTPDEMPLRRGAAGAGAGDSVAPLSDLQLCHRADGTPWLLGRGSFGQVGPWAVCCALEFRPLQAVANMAS